MSSLSGFVEFFKQVALTTLGQFIWLLGLLFIFGFILHILARFTRAAYIKSDGVILDVAITGWIGTPIHELGHAIFCLLFKHKISNINLYSPNSDDGTLGFVKHSFNPKSYYQKIGNFFIGIGPIIFGVLVLYALFYYLVPNAHEVIPSIESQSKVFVKIVHSKFAVIVSSLSEAIFRMLETIFQKRNFLDYKFWIFLYLSICISSHMELSPLDIKGARGGLLYLFLFFFFINFIVIGIETIGGSAFFGKWWQYIKMDSYALMINKWVGAFSAMLIVSAIFSGLYFFVTYSILTIFTLAKGRSFFSPFLVLVLFLFKY